MSIKKRPVENRQAAAAIEAFGAAADTKPAPPAPTVKPMLIRFDADEHALLRAVAEANGRSMHNMVKTLLIPALEELSP